MDWPDFTWKLVRETPDDHKSARYFSAFGRDVDVAEMRLAYDEASRRLSVVGGSRKEAKAMAIVDELVNWVKEHPSVSGRDIEQHMPGDSKSIREALKLAVKQNRIQRLPTIG